MKRIMAACGGCGVCTELCPVHLSGLPLYPHRIARQLAVGQPLPEWTIRGAVLCRECGICETASCPLGLSPRALNRAIKDRLIRPEEEGRAAPEVRGEPPGGSDRGGRTAGGRGIPWSRLVDRLHLHDHARRPLRENPATEPVRVELLLSDCSPQSRILVREGDRVGEGEPVAEPASAGGASLHASIGGTVVRVDEERIVVVGTGT